MPRRATSTSYGHKRQNKPGALPGNAQALFKKAMQRNALNAQALARVRGMLKPDADPEDFKWAWKEAADRGFGKPQQAVDVTSKGDKLPGVILLPAELPDE